ncbi:MAG: RNA polymerase sigma factor, partial [Planctomycetes bacterium]|nr:RNA polymerase sigma factor [Planctomycetota bacterium]
MSDRELLERFLNDQDEEAFAALVERYKASVMGICRRLLGNDGSAEDAFQATFLILAQQASRIRKRASLAGWLHSVAVRTALRARAERHRRRMRPLQNDMMITDDLLDQLTKRYEYEALHEELDQLPDRYREPLILRYWLGQSNEQIASRLGLPLGVVEGRIKRGKERLRLRLARHGIGLSASLVTL